MVSCINTVPRCEEFVNLYFWGDAVNVFADIALIFSFASSFNSFSGNR